jgi:hypothetical protein
MSTSAKRLAQRIKRQIDNLTEGSDMDTLHEVGLLFFAENDNDMLAVQAESETYWSEVDEAGENNHE